MKTAATLAFIAAFAAAPVFAQDQAAPAAAVPAAPAQPVVPAPEKDAAGIYQVFRTTDKDLNCAQLTSEMNLLNAQIKEQTEKNARQAQGGGTGRRVAGGALGGALGGLAPHGH